MRNFVVYRILLIVVFITTVYALLLVAIINNGFADFDFMLCFVTSTVNIFIALNELRSHTDATLEVTDDADRVKVGNFKFWDKCTVRPQRARWARERVFCLVATYRFAGS